MSPRGDRSRDLVEQTEFSTYFWPTTSWSCSPVTSWSWILNTTCRLLIIVSGPKYNSMFLHVAYVFRLMSGTWGEPSSLDTAAELGRLSMNTSSSIISKCKLISVTTQSSSEVALRRCRPLPVLNWPLGRVGSRYVTLRITAVMKFVKFCDFKHKRGGPESIIISIIIRSY